jgi:predicted transglutaminase-like cysteine proteinase
MALNILYSNESLISENQPDSDGDGYIDKIDYFPFDPSAYLDTDEDGFPDRWNIGMSQLDSTSIPPLSIDEFPFNPSEWNDSDGDRVGDNSDEFPRNPYEWIDNDKDGFGDNSDINPQVNLSIKLKLEKFKIIKKIDLLRWAQIYFEIKIDGISTKFNNNGGLWYVRLYKDQIIEQEIVYDIPDNIKDQYTTIEITMYDYEFFKSPYIVDISNENNQNYLTIKLDNINNSIDANDLSTGTEGQLWYKITLANPTNTSIHTYNMTYRWTFNNNNLKLELKIPVETYKTYTKSDINRIPQNSINFRDLMSSYVTYNDKIIVDLSNQLLTLAKNKNYDSLTTANFILRFVQENIAYTSDSDTKGCLEYWRLPIETLVDAEGDCEDSSVLYASIMKSLGYETALLFYSWDEDGENIGHLSVGLRFDNITGSYVEDDDGNRYYYCETTTEGFTVGKLPDDIKNKKIKNIIVV